jgi:hypothetical protein
MPDEDKAVKWTVTLGGGEWNTVKYGVVEYLRKHRRIRVATAIVGVLWMFGWLASLGGLNWHVTLLPTASMFFVTPTLLWLAVVSGPDFRVVFGETKAPAPKSDAQPAKGMLDPEGYGIESLNQRLVSTEAYARGGFRWSMFALIAGVAFGLAEILFSSGSFNAHIDHSQVLGLLIVAGTMLLLSAILLLRSMMAFRRASAIQDKLLDMQKAITAIRCLETVKKLPVSIDSATVINRLMAG